MRGLNSMKTMAASKGKIESVARSRFDKMEPPSPEKAEIQKVKEKAGHTNTKTARYVDPTVDEKEAIESIELPAHTLYLIDKVVRAKALQGPIGVDNSEVINIELERELRRRQQSLYPEDQEHDGVNEQDLTE